MSQPKSTVDKINSVVRGWERLAPEKTFGGMTLAQFKSKIKPSFDTRDELSVLESQTQSKLVERATADEESLRFVQLVVNGVIGDPDEGPDSDLYESFGYTRKSQRKTGLTRKTKPTTDNGGGK